MEKSIISKSPEIILMDTNGFKKLRADLNIMNTYDVVQAMIIFLTLAVGFFSLLYSLFDRRRKIIWSLWCSFLCGFIQVCFCAAGVFAEKFRKIDSPDAASIPCNDVYTIPMICDIVTLAIIVISAFDAHVKNSKAVILKPVLFLYMVISTVTVIALQSWTTNYRSGSFMLTTNIELQSTLCCRDPNDALMIAVGEYVLIFIPIAVVLLFVYLRHRKSKDRKEMQFFVPCNEICATCEHQNTVCRAVLMNFFVFLYVFRPANMILCSVYNVLYQDIFPRMVSIAIYIYLCFEYCIILERRCNRNKETQTDKSDTTVFEA